MRFDLWRTDAVRQVVVSLAFAFSASLCVPAHAEVLVRIDKAEQRMTVSVDGETRYVWPVSTGKAGYATPSGSFRAFRMEADHYSKEWDEAPMPHSIFFTKEGHAIHGSYETKRLGSPASHGCVRLAPQHAATLFRLVQQQGVLQTRVVLTGGTPAVARRSPPRRPAPEGDAADSYASQS
jgi:lipoprotein-anchoring transpeptidase ErfK/SrfK